MIQESYIRLFNKDCSYETKLEYNRRLSPFNANIKLHRNKINVNLNLQWKDIEEEIKIGLIQHLLLKIFKQKKSTANIDLYNNFVKQIPLLAPKTKSDPHLKNSFNRLNEQYFFTMELPNLQWGRASFRKLASYNFHSDTVTVSTLFKDARQEVLDFLMYHELLHKHHQFEHNNGRNSYHSPAFKRDEAMYPNFKEMEKEIERIIRKNKPARKRSWLSLFR